MTIKYINLNDYPVILEDIVESELCTDQQYEIFEAPYNSIQEAFDFDFADSKSTGIYYTHSLYDKHKKKNEEIQMNFFREISNQMDSESFISEISHTIGVSEETVCNIFNTLSKIILNRLECNQDCTVPNFGRFELNNKEVTFSSNLSFDIEE